MLLIKKMFLVLLVLSFTVGMMWAAGKQEEAKEAAEEEKVVELWHYWTTENEKATVDGLRDGFQKKYPGVKLIDRAIPGSTAEIRQQVSTAILGGNPPEVFQSLLGYQLKSFADAGTLVPVTDIWNEINGDKIFLENIAKMAFFDNEAWGIPFNIHTINPVWYNVEVFKKYNLKEPTTWEEFQQVCKVLKENGVAPLIDAAWWTVFAFEPFLIETVGIDGWGDIGQGKTSFTEDKRIRKAFELFKEYFLDNLIENWSGYSWAEAAQPLIKGEVAMYFSMGNWLGNLLETNGLEPIKDFDFFIAPNTEKVLIGQAGTFGLLKDSDSPNTAKLFLKYLSTPEAQMVFSNTQNGVSTLKGSVSYENPILDKFARLHDNPDYTFIINYNHLMPPAFYTQFYTQIEKYAADPTPKILDEVLKELENLRIEARDNNEWVDWGY